MSRWTSRNVFIITPDTQPLYDVDNKYMGFLFLGKIRDFKKEKNRVKNMRKILTIVAMISMFIIGYKASFFIIIVSIIALISSGCSIMLGEKIEIRDSDRKW